MREVTVGNVVSEVHELGPSMDAAFDRLYGKVTVAGADPELDAKFKAAAFEYFDGLIGNASAPGAHDHFFYGFSPLWSFFLVQWRVDLAEGIWRLAIEFAHEWERMNSGHLIDKGVPYYYGAITALLNGQIDSGYVLAHQAAEEDSRTSSGLKYPDTPAFALVSLNDDKVDQAFKFWVDEQAKFFETFITDYGLTHGRTFGIDEVRRKFLRNPPNHDVVFLLSYTIARLKAFSELPDGAKRNPFVGQLQLDLLFDLTLVIDNAIKHKNKSIKHKNKSIKHKNRLTFADHCTYLLDRCPKPLKEFRKINADFDKNFSQTLTDALNEKLTMNHQPLNRMQCDVAVAYGIRNRWAHNIESERVVWDDFDRIQKAIFRTLCATVDYLY